MAKVESERSRANQIIESVNATVAQYGDDVLVSLVAIITKEGVVLTSFRSTIPTVPDVRDQVAELIKTIIGCEDVELVRLTNLKIEA
jgi:hypothetical protein